MTKYPLNFQNLNSSQSEQSSNTITIQTTENSIENGQKLKQAIDGVSSYHNKIIFLSPGNYDINTSNLLLDGEGEVTIIGLGDDPKDHKIYSSFDKKGEGVVAVKTQKLFLKNLTIENTKSVPYVSEDQWKEESAWHRISFTPSGAFTRCALSQNRIDLEITSEIPGINGIYTLNSNLANYDRSVYGSRLVWSRRVANADGKYDIHLAMNVDSHLESGEWEIFSYQNNTKTILAHAWILTVNPYRWPWELKNNSWKNAQEIYKLVNIKLLNNEMHLENVILKSSDISCSMRSNMPYFGTFKNVEAGYAAFGGVEGYISGYLENCVAQDYSFGSRFYQDVAWPTSLSSFTDGVFINCRGYTYSFGAEGYIRGKFINCSAGHPDHPITHWGEHGILTGDQSAVINYQYITNN